MRNVTRSREQEDGRRIAARQHMDSVLLGIRGDVRVITLNEPLRLNALNLDLLARLADVIAAVKRDDVARAVVVTGAGRAFCAGADLGGMFGDTGRPVEELRDHLMGVYESFLGLRDLDIPTIAAVHGAAVGAGLNIALACDVIVAGPRAKFSPTFAEIGLHPGGGCTWMLTQRIGRNRAAAALLRAEPIGTDEAWQLGLAEVLADDPLARALELADLFAGRDRVINASILESVRVAAESDLATSVDFESWAQARSVSGPRFQKFVATFTRV